MSVFLKWLTLTIAIYVASAVKSQKIFFEQLTTAEGLPSDYVNTVFRDSKGFLWIATDKGTCRYDGRHFLYLNKDNGLPSNFVNCFAEDPDGNIWMGTIEGGICKYDGKKITPFVNNTEDVSNDTRQIHFNEDKSFFLVTFNSLYYCRSEKAIPEKVKDCSGFLAPISKNEFIVGKGSDSLFKLTKANHELSLQRLGGPAFFRISGKEFILRNGNQLMSYEITSNGFIFKRNFILKKKSLPANIAELKDLLLTKNALFIATVSGLIYIDENNNELFLSSANGMGADYIRSIYEDNGRNLFFCTFGGGVKIWPTLYLQEFKTEGKVTSIFPAGDQTYITTTRNVYKYDHSINLLMPLPNLEGGNYTVGYRSTAGKFYLGTLNSFYELPGENFLGSLSKKNKPFYTLPANTGASGFIPIHDSLFVSTYGEGITIYNRKINITKRFGKGGPNIIEFLTPLKNRFAALTYNSGLSLFDNTDFTNQITTKDGLLSNSVYSVFQEKDDEIWIGTLKGLNLFNGKKIIKTFSEHDGLTGNKVICIFRDAQKRFWVLSDKYLHLLEKDKLRAIRSHPFLYDEKNSMNRATYDQKNDMLYIGLNNALLTVDVKKIVPDTDLQLPALTNMMIDTLSFRDDLNKKITSKRSEKVIFSFSSQFAPLSQKNDLFYKLSGFDDDWHLMDNSSEVVYQKLPPGYYELFAKKINADGYASPEVSLARLEILPPVWKQPWFIISVSLFLLAGFFLTGQIISKRRYKQKILRLQEEYRLQLERERIAMELHDNVGSQLTYLINKIDDDYSLLADKEEADKLSNFARGAMQELRETIWALDKKEILLYDLDHKIMQLVELYNREKNIVQYDWNSNSRQPVSLKSIKALNIYRIIQESLNNAVKYSEATHIIVSINFEDPKMFIRISDNGKGFNIAEATPGYGLRNMKNRAAEMNALFNIKTEPGKGTLVTLSVHID